MVALSTSVLPGLIGCASNLIDQAAIGRRPTSSRTGGHATHWTNRLPGALRGNMAVVVDMGATEHSPPQGDTDVGRGYTARHQSRKPASSDPRARSAGCPIDHAHLARYTLGDAALELEVLTLFADEAPRTLARLRSAAAANPFAEADWQAASHTLKGSARAVGAVKVALAAEAAERAARQEPAGIGRHLSAMSAAVAEAGSYIASLGLAR